LTGPDPTLLEGTGSRLSLRQLLAILLAIFGVLIGALIVVASLQVSGSARQTRAANRQTSSYVIAESLRQSSNDLTMMVRLYVSTGELRYRGYYNQILAIRAGTAPRPLDYGGSFWDRVLADGTGFVRYGPRESLTAQMRAAHFAPDEFRALQAGLAASNRLAVLENAVMRRTARLIARGDGADYPTDVAPLYRRLVDHAYLAQKGAIMAGIDHFVSLVDGRTRQDVESAQAYNSDLTRIEIGILVAVVLVGLGALVVLTRLVLHPLDLLTAAARRIAGGDYAHRVRVRSVTDLERVAGTFNAMAGAVQSDVAAREAAERDAVAARQVAEHANRAKSTFLAAMSHEIRTPMIGVTGMLEVLARTDLTPAQRQMVRTAESSAASLLQIIGDILDFSKIEADKLELAPVTFSLVQVVRASVETFMHTASAKGLLLSWTVDDGVADAYVGDPLRIRQIVSNLLSNAVKFTEVGGIEVTVTATSASGAEQSFEVVVRDTGIGIEPEHQQRLFEEFAQAGAETTARYGGTGLGLVICRRLAVLMGGDIALESVPGKGTAMSLTLTLPLGDPAEIDEPAPAPGSAPPSSRPRPDRAQAERERSLLLLAEDHPVNRTVLEHQLALVGFHVDTAVDGEEAYEKWLTGRYALLFTDLNMPRLDGYELARRVRARERETGADPIPIVALSANVMQGEPERCREAGMDDFAAKPATIPVLAGRLRRWLPHVAWSAQPAAASGAAAPAPLGSDREPFDAAVLEQLTGGDPELTASVLDDWIETTRGDVRDLEEAIRSNDRGAARRQAHRIKGAAALVGAHEVVARAARVETTAAAETDVAGLRELVEAVSRAVETRRDH
jgi:signal transduction histidine kinase/CheY-like chemotaxis protein